MSTMMDSQTGLEGGQRTPTYGGWRKTQGLGFFGLSTGSSILVLGSVVTFLVLATINIVWAGYAFLPLALVLFVAVVRWSGESLWDRSLRRFRWTWGSMRGYHSLRGGVLIEHDHAWSLPGVLAPTRLVECDDGNGGRFGLVHDQRSGLLTATLRCDARSTWLVDGAEADMWVANWGAWLGDLGIIPMVCWVAVTVETAPESGSTLASHVARRMDPRAPTDSLNLLAELVIRAPNAAADVNTRTSITFDPRRSLERLPDLADQTAEVSRLLSGLESSLNECGVGVLGRATPEQLAGMVRVAYDPLSRGDVAAMLAPEGEGAEELLRWGESGPVSHEESWGEYHHDSGWSVTWSWYEAPRQQVTSNVLGRLLSPGAYPRRVTMIYRPLPAELADRVLEAEVNAATIRGAVRRKQGRDETERERADHQRASQAAAEEARGAGVVRPTMYVTVTVTDYDQLAAACADVEQRAQQCKIRLRRLYASQAAGFAVTLPAGVHPKHAAGRGRR